jgi:hypothetical protein
VAAVTVQDAVLPFIDEHPHREPEGESYEFLPGRHMLWIARAKHGSSIPLVLIPVALLTFPLAAAAGGAAIGAASWAAQRRPSRGMALACPTFEAGHHYLVLARLNEAKSAWHPLVWDVSTRAWVEIRCPPDATDEGDDDQDGDQEDDETAP